MALQDAIQGARHTGQLITWSRNDGTPEPLTGSAITARITDLRTGVTVNSDGVFAISDGPNGIFTWAYGVNDVAAAGPYEVQFKATFTTYDLTYLTEWLVGKAN